MKRTVLLIAFACSASFACTDLAKTCSPETCGDGKTTYKQCSSTNGITVKEEFFDSAGTSKASCSSSDSNYSTCVSNAIKSGGPICP